MKINMPVTQHEISLKDSISIVSKTDLQGKITFVNRDFVEVSGFTEDELLGQNQNILRHPDMPAEAFADLWATIKSEKPWIGIVKNRCKNGDHYWVEACITPMRERGVVTGYVSVRRKATREQIEGAIKFHKILRGEIGWLAGVLNKARNLINKFTLNATIATIFAMVALTSVSLGYVGLTGVIKANHNNDALYQDHLIPLRQLKTVSDMYAVNIVDTSHKVRNGNLSMAQGEANVENALKEVDKQWKNYTSRALSTEEKKLVAETKPLFVQANQSTAKLKNILHGQDIKRMAEFTTSELYPAIDPLTSKINDLSDLILNDGAADTITNKDSFEEYRNLIVIFTIIGLAVCGLLGFRLNRAIMPRLLGITHHLQSTAQGEHNAPVERTGHRDELTDVMDAYRSLKTRLDFDNAETLSGVDRIKSALDNSTIPVTVGDENNKLIYMNKAGFSLWRDMSSNIAKRHPEFSVDKLVGGTLGKYIENEEDRANYVAELTGSKVLEIKMAEHNLQLTFNPVTNKDGEYLGRMIQWVDRTAEVAAERSVAFLIEQTIAGNLKQRLDQIGRAHV